MVNPLDHFEQQSCSHSCSPFVSLPVISQTANANNHFAPKPFGNNTSPFGSQTGNLVFGGGKSMGVFGEAQSCAPFPSTTTFCDLSSPMFGSTLSTFGSTPTPAFGSSSSSSFGGSSIFGQNSNGGFGYIPTQTNPLGSTNQQSQPALESNVFSSPFDSSSYSALGASSTPSCNTASSTPTFGATNTSTFGATSTPAFGTTSNPVIGTTSTHAFGTTSTPAFGSSSTHAFGSIGNALSTPSFGGCCCTPSFCRPTSAFRSSTFGSRVALYASTTEPNDVLGRSPSGEFQSISAMPDYKYKSHEELRWEDYLSGDKGGGRLPAGQSTAQPNLQGSSTFSQSNSSPFSTAESTNPPANKPSSFGFFGLNPSSFAPSIPSHHFATMPVISRNPFGSTTAASTSSFPAISSNHFATMPAISSNPFATMPVISRNPSASTTAAATSSFSSISLNHFATTPAVSSNRFASTTSAPTFSFPSLPKPEPPVDILPTQSFDGQLGRIASTTKPYDKSAQTVYGGQHGGSRVVRYSSTTQPNDGSSVFTNLVLMSISAMTNYEDKSHEELRWEDYQSGGKGGRVSIGGQSNGGIGFGVGAAQPNLQGSSTFGQSSSNPSSIVISANNPFAQKPSGFGTFGPSMTISFNSSEPAALSIPLNPSFSFQSFNVFFNP